MQLLTEKLATNKNDTENYNSNS